MSLTSPADAAFWPARVSAPVPVRARWVDVVAERERRRDAVEPLVRLDDKRSTRLGMPEVGSR